MKTSVRYILGLVGVLIIGFGLGFVTHRSMINKRVHNVNRVDRSSMIANRIIDITDATEAQADSIRLIVHEDMETIRKERKEHFKANREKMQKMFQRLKNQLNEDQIEKLEKEKKRIMRKHRNKKKRRHKSRRTE